MVHGAWGLSLLKAGVDHVTFVDQGNFSESITNNCKKNGLLENHRFMRADVFRFLDEAIRERLHFGCVVSDPPAFTKRPDQLTSALRGYAKLHEKCLTVIERDGVFVAASCTSFISHEQLDETVQRAASKLRRKVWLMDIGIQKSDHLMKGLKADENYIKYLCYYVE